jgi:uridine kinase
MNGDLQGIVDRVVNEAPQHRRWLLAVDGVGASGKTTFAAALAAGFSTRPVVVLHVDDFFNPAEIRHRKGRHSPEGFWLDTYNYDAFISTAVMPLRSSGNHPYRTHSYDRHRPGRDSGTH